VSIIPEVDLQLIALADPTFDAEVATLPRG